MKSSIVISSYNYGRYLGKTIDSALAQTNPTEVIVIDDGSVDDSRAVIERYAGRIGSVLKDNEGQASVINLGFAMSSGDVICFLDSDDLLLPHAMAEATSRLACQSVGVPSAKAHWRMEQIDGAGLSLGRHLPVMPLGDGLLLDSVLSRGPANYGWPPTSGNVWTRGFLETVLPMPVKPYRVSPDLYLAALAPAYGAICAIDQVLGQYRVHDANHMHAPTLESFVAREMPRWEVCRQDFLDYCRGRGIDVGPHDWKSCGWVPRLQKVLEGIHRYVPRTADLLLLDDAEFPELEGAAGRRVHRLMERDGIYWGLPQDSAEAVLGLSSAVDEGVRYVVHPWTTYWWRETYADFFRYLATVTTIEFKSRNVTVYRFGPTNP